MSPFRPLSLVSLLVLSGDVLAAQRPAPPPPAREEAYVPEPTQPSAVKPAAGKPEAPAALGIPNTKEPKLAAPGAPPAAAPVQPALSPRFQQVRERIDGLFGHRTESPPAFDARRNPFRPAGAAPVAAVPRGEVRPVENLPPSDIDLALLKQIAATLKVAGTIEIEGRAHLIINQRPYKAGDVINTRLKEQAVFVRLKQISRYSYTLSFNEAEISVKF